jgi:TldD protein
MIAGLDHGILLAGFNSGIEDPHGWGIQFICNRGYEIRQGRKTGRVFAPVGVTGYVPDILGSISQVGRVMELTPGTCGKGFKEFLPVSSGGPHLRFRAQLA